MFKLTEVAARFMNLHPEYAVDIEEEIHHLEKQDMPSGTAIALSEKLISNIKRKKSWVLNSEGDENQIEITALREPDVPGTHIVSFSSRLTPFN